MGKKKQKPLYRQVLPLNPAIWRDAHDFLLQHDEEILYAVSDAVDQGYTPEEIYRHWLREAGYHRQELAVRCRNAAKHLNRQRELT